MLTQKESNGLNFLNMTEALADRMKKLRKALDIGQEEMAEKLGVHHQTYSKYERGEIKPGADIFLKLVAAFGANPVFLTSGKGELFTMEPVKDGQREGEPRHPWKQTTLARRWEDREYINIDTLREHGPEIQQGKPVLRLKALRSFYGDCDLAQLRFALHTESNFAPMVQAGNVLIVDLNAKGITSSYYIMKYDEDSFALRRLEPIDAETCKVVFAISNGQESAKELPMATVRGQIVGRVVWIVRKV